MSCITYDFLVYLLPYSTVLADLQSLSAFFPSHRLGDDGGQAICRALKKNNTLTHVHLGSNDLGEPTASVLSQVWKNVLDVNNLGAVHATPRSF